jgi:anti-sigma B factor antagonist
VDATPNEVLRIEVLHDERTIVLHGELDMADTDTLTRAAAPLAAERGDLILDLHALTFIDSSGLLALLRTADRLREGNLVLRKPSDTVRHVLDLVELTAVSPRIVIEA